MTDKEDWIMMTDPIKERVRKSGVEHSCKRTAIYKKKLAPKGYSHLVIKIKGKFSTYSMSRLIPVEISKEQQQLVEYDMVDHLIEHYDLSRYS